MTRKQAHELFRQGRIHPHCPGCGATRLLHMVAAWVKSVLIRGYECTQCQERFKVWIDG